jgi:hypothetical protein
MLNESQSLQFNQKNNLLLRLILIWHLLAREAKRRIEVCMPLQAESIHIASKYIAYPK